MVVARCENYGCPEGDKGNAYSSTAHCPAGHPKSGIVCGTANSNNHGLVWLLDYEQRAYLIGPAAIQADGQLHLPTFVVE
jgi:hypothetical protein